MMFHIESAHAALNFYILLVLSFCLVYTLASQLVPHELVQLLGVFLDGSLIGIVAACMI